jgi:hypothetical protein
LKLSVAEFACHVMTLNIHTSSYMYIQFTYKIRIVVRYANPSIQDDATTRAAAIAADLDLDIGDFLAIQFEE